MISLIVPALPWVVEGLAAGATALGLGEAIRRWSPEGARDAVENAGRAVGNFIEGVGRGGQKLIRTVSTSMSPANSGTTTIPNTRGGYTERTDAIRTSSPLVLEARAAGSSSRTASSTTRKPRGKKAAAGTTTQAPSTSTRASTPNPQNNNDSIPLHKKVLKELVPFKGYKGGSWYGNTGRVLRDATAVGFGADLGINLYESAENPDYNWQWGISHLTTFPERGALNVLRGVHNRNQSTTPSLQDTTTNNQKSTPTVTQVDSIPTGRPQGQTADTVPVVNGLIFNNR